MRPVRLLAGIAGLAVAAGAVAAVAGPVAASGSKNAPPAASEQVAAVHTPDAHVHEHGHDGHEHGAKTSTEAFDQGMRKLWEDHITWTRLFIVSATADLPDLQATTDRLLRNQTDIGDAITPFYGDAAGAQLTALLRVHILTAADLLAAAKANDAAAIEAATQTWYANADDIAAFLSSANPKHWPLADMQAMMREHLDLTLAEAVAHLQGRYADDVAAYDQVHDEILQMADMLASGIEQQFPSRFAG